MKLKHLTEVLEIWSHGDTGVKEKNELLHEVDLDKNSYEVTSFDKFLFEKV